MLFKKCPKCGYEWTSRDHFLSDSNIKIIGYQNNLEELSEGIFLFNHSCKTTLAVLTAFFTDLHDSITTASPPPEDASSTLKCFYAGKIPTEIDHDDPSFVSDLIQIIRRYPRNKSQIS